MSPLNKEFKDISDDKFHREAKVNCKLGERQRKLRPSKPYIQQHTSQKPAKSKPSDQSKTSPAIDEAKISFVIIIVIKQTYHITTRQSYPKLPYPLTIFPDLGLHSHE